MKLEYNFTIDVCADTTNNKVKNYFNEKANGLAQSWQNNVCWCNPPYTRNKIELWVKKAALEVSDDCTIVMLLPARTDTRWFHDYIYRNPNCKITFLRGRLKFSGHKNSAPFPSMIVEFKLKKSA
jgi:site-specific DNA-methyltransferase (adenine-specific)